MQIKSSLFVLSLFFSLHANAAFNAKESKELLQINDQHHVALSDAKKIFWLVLQMLLVMTQTKKMPLFL